MTQPFDYEENQRALARAAMLDGDAGAAPVAGAPMPVPLAPAVVPPVDASLDTAPDVVAANVPMSGTPRPLGVGARAMPPGGTDETGARPPGIVDAAVEYATSPLGIAQAIGGISPAAAALGAGAAARGEIMSMPPRPRNESPRPEATMTTVEPFEQRGLDPLLGQDGKPVLQKPAPSGPSGKAPPDPYGITAGRAAQVSGMQAQKQAKIDAASSERDKLEAVKRMTDDAENAYRDAIKKKRDADFARASALQQHADDTDKLIDEVRSGKIDPNQYFRNAGTVEHIANMASLVLGGMLQGRFGLGENPAARLIRERVQDDLDAQKAVLDNKKTAIQARNLTFGQLEKAAGDRALAEHQFIIGGLESAKRTILAEAERLGGETTMARAREAAAAIDRELGAEWEKWGMANEAVSARKSAAQHAEAIRAQKYADDRADKAREFALKERSLDIEEGKAAAAGAGKVNDQTSKLSSELVNKKVPEMEQSIRGLAGALPRKPDGTVDTSKPIEGLGRLDDAKAALDPIVRPLIQLSTFGTAPDGSLLSRKARENRLDLERNWQAYRVAVTGAGGSEREIEGIKNAYLGARTPAEIAHAVTLAQDYAQTLRANIEAGYDPQTVQTVRQRAASATPPSMSKK